MRSLPFLACLLVASATFAAELPAVPANSIANKKELLFSDDFEGADPPKQWHKVVPTFAVEKGVLKGTQTRDKTVPAENGKPAVTPHAAVHGLDIPTKDSVVEVKIRFEGASMIDVEFDDRKYTGSHYGHLCRAQVRLTGVTLIQLTAGSPTAPLLRSGFGGPPPRITGQGSQIDVIVERSEDIVLRASEAMAAVRDLLTDENIARVSHIIQNLDTVSNQLADQRGIISQGGHAAESVSRAADNVAALAAQTQRDLAGLQEVVANLRTASASVSGETLPEINRAAEELSRASQSISRVANNLEDNPSILTPRSPRPTVELPR